MKKIILALIIFLFVFILTGCTAAYKYPRVDIAPSNWRIEHTYLPLREKHRFAEVPYTIEETDMGYNIVIHCVKEK